MTKLKILGLFILVGQSSLLVGQTQAQLTAESTKRLKKAEAELSSVYNKILTTYSDDTEFIKNLKESQDLWMKFSKAELKAKYPERQPGYYGSAHAMCVNNYEAELINERIEKLRIWLTGVEEGDVCSGSVRGKN